MRPNELDLAIVRALEQFFTERYGEDAEITSSQLKAVDESFEFIIKSLKEYVSEYND